MAVWVVRAGRKGAQEKFALDNGYAVIDWRELGDIFQFQTRDELHTEMSRVYPHKKPRAWAQFVGETWAFAREVDNGDLFVLPLKTRNERPVVGSMRENGIIAVGKFDGKYEYAIDGPPGTEHRRKVRWIRRDIPRADLDDDIFIGLNVPRTVYRPGFRQAEERIRKIAEGR